MGETVEQRRRRHLIINARSIATALACVALYWLREPQNLSLSVFQNMTALFILPLLIESTRLQARMPPRFALAQLSSLGVAFLVARVDEPWESAVGLGLVLAGAPFCYKVYRAGERGGYDQGDPI